MRKSNNEFKNYHPIVNFTYFVSVIGFSMFFMNPICLFITFFCGFLYSALLGGIKSLKFNLLYMIPLLIISALINPAFNHEGATIIEYLPSGNPLTLESIAYGFAAAVMTASVILWFSCYNEIMTSDKFIYLFGRIIPSMSLVFSMTLRLVPKFISQLKIIADSQKCMGRSVSEGSIIRRIKNGLSILSVMTAWAFENSIETADSMKGRGYGLKGRTAFSIYKFDSRDTTALICILCFASYIIFGSISGVISYSYFPVFSEIDVSMFSSSVFAAYFGLCIFPAAIEIREAIKWKSIESKI